MRTCDLDGCSRKHYAFGLCQFHWWRRRQGRELQAPIQQKLRGLPIAERLMAYVERTDAGCWRWTGRLSSAGYGETSGERHGVKVLAHRVSYETFVGPIPDGLHIDHLCRNRACINPEHLEPVTLQENLRRGREARK